MIFDIKMDGKLTRKYRFVYCGHTTDTPVSITYSSVVSGDSHQIAFMIAALNYIGVFADDIGNEYFNAPGREKIWTKSGPEFGSQQGCVMLIARSLYGLKYSCTYWREMLAKNLGKDGPV